MVISQEFGSVMLPNSFLFRYVRSAPADRCVLVALMRNNRPRSWRNILKKLICKIAQVRVLMDKFGWQEMHHESSMNHPRFLGKS